MVDDFCKELKQEIKNYELESDSLNILGWFYGFELHLIINNMEEILSVYLTKGNVVEPKHQNAYQNDRGHFW